MLVQFQTCHVLRDPGSIKEWNIPAAQTQVAIKLQDCGVQLRWLPMEITFRENGVPATWHSRRATQRVRSPFNNNIEILLIYLQIWSRKNMCHQLRWRFQKRSLCWGTLEVWVRRHWIWGLCKSQQEQRRILVPNQVGFWWEVVQEQEP